jgi:hypothetical protein
MTERNLTRILRGSYPEATVQPAPLTLAELALYYEP